MPSVPPPADEALLTPRQTEAPERRAVRSRAEHKIVRRTPSLGAMEQRLSLVTLGVRDLARARAFYEALGWENAQQPDDEVCFFQAGGMVFGLWTALGGHGAPGIELAQNVRSPEEVGRQLAEAQAAGGTIVREPHVAEWGGTTGAFADPDGYVWEVAHNPFWTIRDDGTVSLTS